MDEATVAKALQTDLNFHKVKIQVKWVQSQLYILASRDDAHYVNYEFLFSLIQTRLEQLKIPDVESFTLYGKVSGSKEPEWKKLGLISQHSSNTRPNHVDTLVVSNGKVEKIKSEYDPSHVYPNTTKLVNELNSPKKSTKSSQQTLKLLPKLSIALVIISGGSWLAWERSQQYQTINQAQILRDQPFDPNQPYKLANLESDRQNLNKTLSGLKAVPDLPFSDYQTAQAQIPQLQARLAQIDQKLTIERSAVKALASAQKLSESAIAIAKNPPHTSQVWKLAQRKWQESLEILKTIPPSTSTSTEALIRTKAYRANYESISLQFQKQLTADAIAYFLKTETGIGIQMEMRDLKSSGVNKSDFANVCAPFVSFNLDPVQVKTQGVELNILAVEMCNYIWVQK